MTAIVQDAVATDCEADVVSSVRDGLGLILLNRPKVMNALTLDKVRLIDPLLRRWASDEAVHCVVFEGAGEKAFCAGGDIRAMWEANKAGDVSYLKAFFGEEYRLNHLIKFFPKPCVAIMDGITMGGGVGLSVHGSHRVVTERTVFAMPETGIGMIPDVGGTYFLPRLPGHVGMYLALTGARLMAADCYFLGIATHFVPSSRRNDLIEGLSSAERNLSSPEEMQTAVTCVLDMYHEDPGAAPLQEVMETLERTFRGDSVEHILDNLAADPDPWAQQQARLLASKSPWSLKATFRQMQVGAQLDFDRCLQIEWRICQRITMGPDFAEGVRAQIIEKDYAPRWIPPSLAEVDQAGIDGLFGPLEGPDLVLDPV